MKVPITLLESPIIVALSWLVALHLYITQSQGASVSQNQQRRGRLLRRGSWEVWAEGRSDLKEARRHLFSSS